MATAPLPSPQCGEHVEPGGDQPRRQIAASSSSSSSFSHIETLTNITVLDLVSVPGLCFTLEIKRNTHSLAFMELPFNES